MPTEFTKDFLLRFYDEDEETYNRIVELAKQNKRSTNAEMLIALKEYADRNANEAEAKKKTK